MKKQHEPKAHSTEQRLQAVPISDGVAYAPVRILTQDSGEYVPRYSISPKDVASEKERLRAALNDAASDLDAVIEAVTQRIGVVQANIFVAQQMIVRDDALLKEVEALIEDNRINAETACVEVLDGYEARLLEVDNDYLKDRASDIGEVRRRILEKMRGAQEHAGRDDASADGPHMVVAGELMPGEIVSLNALNTAGFLTERGGPASHVAILARAMGIPAVSGIQDVARMIRSGDRVLINGSTGEVVVNPTAATMNLYPALNRTAVARLQTAPPVAGFMVFANINTAPEVQTALDMNAEGIGLYRTEFEFIVADRILNEDEQYERYAHVVNMMNGRPVYLRLADLGGDKAARFLNLPHEENPALGYRGARLLLGQPEILATQARAIARASRHGAIHVIYPMIVDEQQYLKLHTLFMQSVQGVDAGTLKHGIMFEVPSACLNAHALLRVADFGSIGTNDLIQYLFAVDRNNGLVAGDYAPDRPAFWTTVEHVAKAAAKHKKPLSVCGEMGGQPQFLPKLITRGIRCVSVSPRLVGLARITARRAQGLFSLEQVGAK